MLNLQTIRKIYPNNSNLINSQDGLSEDQKHKIFQHWSRAQNMATTAEYFGLTQFIVKEVLKSRGCKDTRRKATDKHNEVMRLFWKYHEENGKLNYTRIAEETGYAIPTVREIVMKKKHES